MKCTVYPVHWDHWLLTGLIYQREIFEFLLFSCKIKILSFHGKNDPVC